MSAEIDRAYSRTWPPTEDFSSKFEVTRAKTLLPSFLRGKDLPCDILDAFHPELTWSSGGDPLALGEEVLDPVTEEVYLNYDDRSLSLRGQLSRLSYQFTPELLFDSLKSREREEWFDQAIEALEALFHYEQDRVIRDYIFESAFISLSGQVEFRKDKFLERLWRLWDIFSIPFKRQWRNSLKVYRFVFSSIFRHGGVYLEGLYPTMGLSQIAYNGKRFRLVDRQSVLRYLPLANNFDFSNRFPKPGRLEGLKNWDEYLGERQTYDEGHAYDGPLIYDTTPTAIASRSLSLELSLDRIYVHRNTIGTRECLADLPILDYVAREATKAKRIGETINVGCQLALVTTDLGFYSLGNLPFSIPEIKANFQVILAGWVHSSKPVRVRLGTGRNDSLFKTFQDLADIPMYSDVGAPGDTSGGAYYHMPFVDPSNPPSSFAPENSGTITPRMVNPVMSTILGEYEVAEFPGGFSAIHVEIGRQEVKSYPVSFVFNAVNPTTGAPDPNVFRTGIEFVSRGTVRIEVFGSGEGTLSLYDGQQAFPVPFDTPLHDTYRTRIDVAQVYDSLSMRWIDRVRYEVWASYLKDPITGELETGWFTLDLEALLTQWRESDPSRASTTLSEYAQMLFGIYIPTPALAIDYRGGDITLAAETAGPTSRVCHLSLVANSKFDRASQEANSGVVAITEAGVFNEYDELIAYSVFPPIIIDSERHHISLDIFIKRGMYEEVAVGG